MKDCVTRGPEVLVTTGNAAPCDVAEVDVSWGLRLDAVGARVPELAGRSRELTYLGWH